MKRQSGFTLIELIIVIVILGILAVTAAPQFFNFGSDARQSTVRGLEGSVKAASELVHARAQLGQFGDADGSDGSGFVQVRDGVFASVDGLYATSDADGIRQALQLGNDWSELTNASDGIGGIPADTYVLAPAGFSQPSVDFGNDDEGCFVFYTWDGDSGQPIIGSRTTDC